MADYRDDRDSADRPSALADMVDAAVRRISTAIAISGALIALAIYARPGPPAYQAFSTGSSIVRVNTRSGTVLECVDGRCGIVVEHGQRLSRHPPERPTPAAAPAAPAPQPAPSLPAPKQTAPQQPAAAQPVPAR